MIKTPTARHLALKSVMMPRDTNRHGTIFGGVLLSQIDLAGDVGARAVIREAGWPEQPLVTVAMDRVVFKEPVLVGDTVSFSTQVTRVGTTSITVHVWVEVDRLGEIIAVTEAEVTYVAVRDVEGVRRPSPLRGHAADEATPKR